MKALIRTLLIICALAGFSASGNLSAQWNRINPFLVANYFPSFLGNADLGAIHFNDGVLWAGWRDLFLSNDTGKTWQRSIIGLPSNYIITDINFFDKLNGLVSAAFLDAPPTSDGLLYKTVDGGLTWKQILKIPTAITNIAFHGSASIIHAIAEDGNFYTSIDGGASWKNTRPGTDYGLCFAVTADNIIYTLTAAFDPSGLLGTISFSSDLGASWNKSSGTPDGDSHTICADSCNPKRLYVVSEDYESTISPANLSQLFNSTDAGNSWVSPLSFSQPYLAGGMTCTTNTIYASSLKSGIYRSTDRGRTWKNIGGPMDCAFDARNIACIDDNIVLVLDAEGSIWKTVNSGGDSLVGLSNNDLALSQNSLFLKDSLLVCDTSVSQSIFFQQRGCNPPTLSKIEVLGVDSLSYSTLQFSSDSVRVTFFPVFDSLNGAELVLTLSNGRQKIVTLSGFGIPRAPLRLLTQNATVDTLGAPAAIPITLNGLRQAENITLVMHYDTTLTYTGSTSPAGAKLDMPGEQWKGRSKLSIANAIPNSLLGYAHFDVYNDSVPIQQVTFDSVTVLTAIKPCQYLSAVSVTSEITSISGCGVLTISRFLHHNRMPDLSIMPNPATGDASITTTMNLGEVSVTLYDMLGAERSTQVLTLQKNSPAKIALHVPNGMYDVRVKSPSRIYDLRVVVNK